jgi:Fe-S cluster biogenesis protein NfuA
VVRRERARGTHVSWLARLLGRDESAAARAAPAGDPERVRAVEDALRELRAAFRADGGDVELAAVGEDWIAVRMVGACHGCAGQSDSLRALLEPQLRARFPWARVVRSVS